MTNRLTLAELTAGERAEYTKALNLSHVMDVEVHKYSKDEEHIGQLDPQEYAVVSGQVDVDATQPVTRQLTLDIALDSDSGWFHDEVEDGPFHPAKFIKVVYCVLVSSIDSWVCVPVFYGPTTYAAYDEVTGTLHIEAQSKESLLLPPNSIPLTKSARPVTGDEANIRLDTLIRRAALDYGETKFKLTKAKERVHYTQKKYDRSVREKGLWPYLQGAARSRGYDLFYDREGFLTLKKLPKAAQDTFWSTPNPAWVFSAKDYVGTDGRVYANVATLPAVGFSLSDFRNKALVYGLRSKNKKTPTLIQGYFFPSNTFGSESDLARNNHRRDMTEVITIDGYVSRKRATQIALATLKRAALVSIESQFQALTVPHLEPHDSVMLLDPGRGRTDFVPKAFTVPLVPDLMSVGFNKRVRVVSKTHRRPRKVKR